MLDYLGVQHWPQKQQGEIEFYIWYIYDPSFDSFHIKWILNPSYPLAFIAAKLSLGLQLTEIKNQATKYTTACFGIHIFDEIIFVNLLR